MITLEEIPGIDAEMALGLQSAGIGSPSILEKLSAAVVVAELEKIVEGKAPSKDEIERWQEAIRIANAPEAKLVEVMTEGELPVAEALSSQDLMESGVSASAVPIARILEEPQGEAENAGRETRTAVPVASPVSEPESEPAPMKRAKPEPDREPLVPERKEVRVKSIEPSFAEPERQEPGVPMKFTTTTERGEKEEDVDRKNRAMSHKEPGRVLRGAVATVLVGLFILVGTAAVVTALAMEFGMDTQFPSYLAWGLLAYPLALLLFLTVGTSARCRLCGQRLYVPRQCRRHERAHRSIFGYGMSLALHVIFFRWFRCSLCGTKQKLK